MAEIMLVLIGVSILVAAASLIGGVLLMVVIGLLSSK